MEEETDDLKLNPKVEIFLGHLNNYQSKMPEKLTEAILEDIGFST